MFIVKAIQLVDVVFCYFIRTVNPRLSAAAFIQNSTLLTRHLFEGGVYSRAALIQTKTKGFRRMIFSLWKNWYFYILVLISHQNQVADLACTHFQYRIYSPGMDQFQVLWRSMIYVWWMSFGCNAALNWGGGAYLKRSLKIRRLFEGSA